MNPGARFIFETLHRFTGSWFLSIAAFTPIVIVGLYLAAMLTAKDLEKSHNYPHGRRTVFIFFILLIFPAALHGAHIIRLTLTNNFLFSLAPAGLFLLLEFVRWKLRKV